MSCCGTQASRGVIAVGAISVPEEEGALKKQLGGVVDVKAR